MSSRLFMSLLLAMVCVVRGIISYDQGNILEPVGAVIMLFFVWSDIKNEWPETTKES